MLRKHGNCVELVGLVQHLLDGLDARHVHCLRDLVLSISVACGNFTRIHGARGSQGGQQIRPLGIGFEAHRMGLVAAPARIVPI